MQGKELTALTAVCQLTPNAMHWKSSMRKATAREATSRRCGSTLQDASVFKTSDSKSSCAIAGEDFGDEGGHGSDQGQQEKAAAAAAAKEWW